MVDPSQHFHLVGIGGSGMSGIAELLLSMGAAVSGSDTNPSPVATRLESLGAAISYTHQGSNVSESVTTLVYSSAVSEKNPELVRAGELAIPIKKRAELLADLVSLKKSIIVAGSHGKTTTTGLIADIFLGAGRDPSVCIGGQFQQRDTGAHFGLGDTFIAESDESDKSFLLFQPDTAVITNIDNEHMNAYGSFDVVLRSFEAFIERVPADGHIVLCVDDPYLHTLAARVDKTVTTYGFHEGADLRAVNITYGGEGAHFEVLYKKRFLGRFTTPLHGSHMVQNALAAIAVAIHEGVSHAHILEGLRSYGGVKRRLEKLYSAGEVLIFSDYGHHPTEIQATLRALRSAYHNRRLLVVFEPHRYSRTQDSYSEFLSCFSACDTLYVTDIYPANEEPLPGITSKRLADDIDHPSVHYVRSLKEVTDRVRDALGSNDIILFLGAGAIGKFAEEFSRGCPENIRPQRNTPQKMASLG